MSKAVDWKAKARELERKVLEQDSLISSLQNDDNASDEKLENLNKLHAQKIRALMKSIQDLKKSLAEAKRLNKDHKRSEMIENLKKEIMEQDIIIKCVRKVADDDSACDEAVIKQLTGGPPRVRMISREEMRIEIKRLKGRLAQYAARKKGAQATQDLSALFPSETASIITEDRNVDTLHNEKIVELLEYIENYKVEITSRDTKVEYLEGYIKKQQSQILDLKGYETNTEFDGTKTKSQKIIIGQLHNDLDEQAKINQDTINRMKDDELSRGGLLNRISELEEKLAQKEQLHKVQIEQLTKEINRIQEQLNEEVRLRELAELELSQSTKIIGKNTEDLEKDLAEKNKLLIDKDIEISTLKGLIEKCNVEIADLLARVGMEDAGIDETQLEMDILRQKVAKLSDEKGIPADVIELEKEQTEYYKKQTKKLAAQAVELQEEVEFLQGQLKTEQTKGTAQSILDRKGRQRGVDLDMIDSNAHVDQQLKTDLADAYQQLQEKKREIIELENEVQVLRNLREKYAALKAKYKEELDLNARQERMIQAIKEEEENRKKIVAPPSGKDVEEVKMPGAGSPEPYDSDIARQIRNRTPLDQLGPAIFNDSKASHNFDANLGQVNMDTLMEQSRQLRNKVGKYFKPKRT